MRRLKNGLLLAKIPSASDDKTAPAVRHTPVAKTRTAWAQKARFQLPQNFMTNMKEMG
jgi:hypothetical protein